MKVGIVSQWYSPEPWFIPQNLAAELAVRGHEVRVLTGFPNYPDGKIYAGYRQRWNDRTVDGNLTTRRVPLYASHDSSAVRRAANYFSFAATSTMAGLRYLKDVDVVYVYLTPATVFAAPAILRLLRGTPSVVHVQDLWPESVTASSMAPSGAVGKLAYRALHRMMRSIYSASSGVVAIAPSMRDLIIERGAEPSKVSVVLNWTDEELFRPVEPSESAKREVRRQGRTVVMYGGNLGPFQDIEGSIRAAASVETSSDIDLVFVGSGLVEQEARNLVDRLGAGNVRFLGRRPPSEMADLVAAADFQLLTIRDLPIFHGAVPSKLQAALACGAPVVAAAPGDTAALVKRSGAGFTCPPEDWQALAERFAQASRLSPTERAAMGDRARDAYRIDMSKRSGVDQLEKALVAAARERRKR
ncbi:glycosyltransferase family 4 protein [Jidongwangia harbinensis]|uniref:glycosyltransferase family 4 protein n=1 Tax=Jidongwangia harbinensis TaxID=2878561 RepID=UPI001CD9240F|nr:glycosyltransferase family 4 protein [Jidongwangia harbinensis]MCA2213266.1 glycosyltransferase family 4 protein [Jidongwangia harbinensis]